MIADSYNLASLFESVVSAVPQRTALVCGEDRRTYRELDERCNQLAHYWLGQGIGKDAHIGIYAKNRVEWIEAMLAAYKIRAVPININFRYVEAELEYMLDNADIAALVYESCYSPVVAKVRDRAPHLKNLLVLADQSDAEAAIDNANDYETALSGQATASDFGTRSGDDLYMLYTGGTTGYPKGTMWRHEDIFFAALQGGNPGGDPISSPAELPDLVQSRDPFVNLSAAPLMHGGGMWNTLIAVLSGGRMVTDCNPGFDAHRLLKMMEQERPNSLMVVGDAMARPLADALESGQYDCSSLFVLGSGGAILSRAVKNQLRRLLPQVIVMDSFGASETGGLGTVMDMQESEAAGPRFTMFDVAAVLDQQLKPLPPGSPEIGRLARSGHIPLGYYKDEEKTRATFFSDDSGIRWVLPGDYARVLADGTIELLGRGSVCINSGGEKIFPEEVEGALKGHPQIYDVVVVGTTHPRFGEQVTAVVQPREGEVPTLQSLCEYCREQIASYKYPKAMVLVEQTPRTPVGKPDYRAIKKLAQQQLDADSAG